MITKFSCKVVCLFAVLIGTGVGLSAQVLATYNLEGRDGRQGATPPETWPEHLSVSPIVRGNAYESGVEIGLTQDGMAFVPKGETDSKLFKAPYSADYAKQHDAYFEVTFSPERGHTYSIGSMVFGTRRASKRSGPNFLEVRCSLDSFLAPIATGIETAGPGGNKSADVWIDFGKTLSNLDTAVTLRFYGYHRNVATDQYGIWVITNPSSGMMVINGEVKK